MRLTGQWNEEPGKALHQAVRAAFVLQGTTLGFWCSKNGVSRAWARDAVTGTRKGPAASALLARILRDARGGRP